MQGIRRLSCAALAFMLIAPLLAKAKQREWQTGKLLDEQRHVVYAGEVGTATGEATTSGTNTYGSATGSSTAIYRVYEEYTIQAASLVYVCQEHIKWRWSKPAKVTVNAPIEFAIEKDHIYIKGEDGKEHEAKIVKKISRSSEFQRLSTQPEFPAPLPASPPSLVEHGNAAAGPNSPASQQGTAEISVTSTPPGADIYIDGNFVGSTPSSMSATVGEHAISIKKRGYKTWERTLKVLGGKINITAELEQAANSNP